MSQKSETETYIFWANPSQLEGEHEKSENVNRDTSETCMDNEENEFNIETSRELKDKTYGNKTFYDVSAKKIR